jgi:hypothetical protein
LYFAGLLTEDRIQQAFGKARSLWQGWIYSPAVTIWVFLAQCMSADHSCREAVAQLIAGRLARRLEPCSAETGAYCTARDRVPEEACQQLMRETGRAVDQESRAEWRWLGHRVLDVDGSTLTMPDTPENQAEYPQISSQLPGGGFPMARIVVVFSLAVGTVLDAAIGRYQGKQTGENSLLKLISLETDRTASSPASENDGRKNTCSCAIHAHTTQSEWPHNARKVQVPFKPDPFLPPNARLGWGWG